MAPEDPRPRVRPRVHGPGLEADGPALVRRGRGRVLRQLRGPRRPSLPGGRRPARRAAAPDRRADAAREVPQAGARRDVRPAVRPTLRPGLVVRALPVLAGRRGNRPAAARRPAAGRGRAGTGMEKTSGGFEIREETEMAQDWKKMEMYKKAHQLVLEIYAVAKKLPDGDQEYGIGAEI